MALQESATTLLPILRSEQPAREQRKNRRRRRSGRRRPFRHYALRLRAPALDLDETKGGIQTPQIADIAGNNDLACAARANDDVRVRDVVRFAGGEK